MQQFRFSCARSIASRNSLPILVHCDAGPHSSTPRSDQPLPSKTPDTVWRNSSALRAHVTTFVNALVFPESIGGVRISTLPIHNSSSFIKRPFSHEKAHHFGGPQYFVH